MSTKNDPDLELPRISLQTGEGPVTDSSEYGTVYTPVHLCCEAFEGETVATWKTKLYGRARRPLEAIGLDLEPRLSQPAKALKALRWLRDQQNSDTSQSDDLVFLDFVAKHYQNSHAQIFQDLFAIFVLHGKRDGYFVEFGATNGKLLSNTLLLERDYGWTGILAEPARSWHQDLAINRTAHIDHRCVSGASGHTVSFLESVSHPAHSVAGRHNLPGHETITYEVETISLADLLDYHDAPNVINYLSVDTEGTEWEILSNFDFSSRTIEAITVEHNGEPNKSQIRELLEGAGFIQVFASLSGWDDWYVSSSLLERM